MMTDANSNASRSNNSSGFSLFARPSFVKTQPIGTEPTTTDYFNRKTLTLEEVSAETERRRQAKHAAKARQRQSWSASEDSPDGKRRRLNPDSPKLEDSVGSDSKGGTDSPTGKDQLSSKHSKSVSPRSRSSSVRLSPSRKSGRFNRPAQSRSKGVVNSTYSSESEQDNQDSGSADFPGLQQSPTTPKTPTTKASTTLEPSDDDSDEDFPRIVQRARERARLQRLEEEAKKNENSVSPLRARGEQLSISDNILSKKSPQDDPTVKIHVTSPLEGTKSIIIVRRLLQPLIHVRKAWCDRHSSLLEEEVLESIILAWNGIRLYEVTTCKSLGLNFNAQGEFLYRGKYYHPESDRYHIALEALPLDMYEGKIPRPTDGGVGGNSEPDTPPPEKKKAPTVKLILKAKNYEPFNVEVKMSTTVKKMLSAFRSRTPNLPSDKELYILFEGDELKDNQTPKDLDLEDMNVLEVYLR